MLNFFNWLCKFNQNHPDDKVQLYGFDTQGSAHDGLVLKDLILRADLPERIILARDIELCVEVRFSAQAQTPEQGTRCMAVLKKLKFLFLTHEREIKIGVGVETFEWAQIALRFLYARQSSHKKSLVDYFQI